MPVTTHLSTPELQTAVTTALRADPTFTQLAHGPFDPAPENQAFPYVTFGDHVEQSFNTFGPNFGGEVLFQVHVWTQSQSFVLAWQIANAIQSVLNGKTFALQSFYNVIFLFDMATKMSDPDGVTRHIMLRYRVWAVALG